ncbi:MAG TPA: hydrogen peroxide-inducible genes activator [Caulobacteraceae bacterium]|jgi:LysR family hydrogen peroxide-inducible transcriptional activator|nr:hydrogen peroxide-inducible genes activator [Caulobacteraceae bacterium]
MLPTLRQLQYLTLLNKHGSFSRAAEAAHVTQPTLSAGIQELEKILGSSLVDRNRSGVILTAAGAEAVVRAAAILNQAEDLVQACRGAGQPLEGRLRLGVIPTIAPFLLPAALPVLKARYPRLRLFLREDLTHRLIADLRGGVLDAVLIALPYDTAGLEVAHVADDELLAVMAPGHALARGAAVPPDTLDREDLILLEDGHCLRAHALAACGLDGRRPMQEEGFAATSLATLVQMVGSGLGVSLVPAMAVEAGMARTAQVCVRPLDPSLLRRQIVVAWRAGSTRATEGRLLAEIFAAAAGPGARGA